MHTHTCDDTCQINTEAHIKSSLTRLVVTISDEIGSSIAAKMHSSADETIIKSNPYGIREKLTTVKSFQTV